MNMRKVGIIGVGHVGAHVALSLAMQGICDEIQLCDIDEEKNRQRTTGFTRCGMLFTS